MGKTESPQPLSGDRPVDGGDEWIQATGDGVSVPDEEKILRKKYGPPDNDGIYGKPKEKDGEK
jgi:hypothetical protein